MSRELGMIKRIVLNESHPGFTDLFFLKLYSMKIIQEEAESCKLTNHKLPTSPQVKNLSKSQHSG